MRELSAIFCCTLMLNTGAQITNSTNTIGLLYSEPEKVSEGFILFAPNSSDQVYLIDNCGLIVNQWELSSVSAYSGCYLLEDGSIIKLTGTYIANGGESCVEHRSWDDVLIWKYCIDYENGDFHSDLHVLPNGNILVIMLENYGFEEAILNGYNPTLLTDAFALETVVELKPIGLDSAEIVWKWRLLDHIIQEHDSTKRNYGIVKKHPRKYNINLYLDFNHYNSIDYNEDLDQIILSSWNDSEVFIIDHSTTMEEAAGSNGGKYGYGGDFLFRWGHPSNYDLDKEQKLLGQHNPRWIPANFKRFGGMISIYNNRHSELINGPVITNPTLNGESAIVVINPDPDKDGVYEMENGQFLPKDYTYLLSNELIPSDSLFSFYMSGAVVQSNGHIITCEADKGRFMEFDTLGNVVWMYQSPQIYYNIAEQGDSVQAPVYKVEKYTSDYSGLVGKNLCGSNTIEYENELSEVCIQYWSPNLEFLQSIDGAKVSFNLQILNSDSVSWNFGDGNTSMENNPTHIFEMPGSYDVCVTGTNCYNSDTFCKTIKITTTSINENNINNSILSYNVVKENLVFQDDRIEDIYIYNNTGKLVYKLDKLNQTDLNVSFLKSGIYFLLVKHQLQSYFRNVIFCKI